MTGASVAVPASVAEQSMDNFSTTTGTLDQTDEGIFTYDVSDEALEAAAGTERADKSVSNWTC
jgi:hypothetical protein